MIAAIITENEHVYDSRLGLTAKRIRCVVDNGYQLVNKTGVKIFIQVFAQTFDADGNEVLIPMPNEGNSTFYTNAEIDAIFTSFNNPINPTDSYTDKFYNMLEAVLLSDTATEGMFNGDTCVPYVTS